MFVTEVGNIIIQTARLNKAVILEMELKMVYGSGIIRMDPLGGRKAIIGVRKTEFLRNLTRKVNL